MSFIRNYLTYSTDNEAPEMFHVWGAYVALSASVGRKVWLPFGTRAMFPNIYVMLVGGAANGKSFALYHCNRLLAEIIDIPISCSIETPEGLLRYMAGDPDHNPPIESPVMIYVKWPDGELRESFPMTIIANEYIDFISKNPEGWTNLLNNIYDQDRYLYRTKNQGKDYLIGPYMVLFGALTTEISSALYKAQIISTGLARRTIFQYGERRWGDPHAILNFSKQQEDCYLKSLEHLKKLRKIGGPFTWSQETREWWISWYGQHNVIVPKQPPQTQGWFGSKPDQVLKLGMLTSLSESFQLNLEISHLQTALECLATLEKDLHKIFGGVGRNELAAVALKIFDYIEAQTEPVPRRKLKSIFWASCRPQTDFEDCIRFLIDDGKIEESFFHVNDVREPVLATPPVMKAFAARVAAARPTAATPSVLPQGKSAGVDPSN